MAVVEIIRSQCIGCEQCIGACPEDALFMRDDVAVVIAERCTGCGTCVEVCPTAAILLPVVEAIAAVASAVAEAETAADEPTPGQVAEATRAGEVWVFVEQTDGRPNTVSWELLGAGREMAEALDTRLAAAVLGDQVRSLADEAIAYGADVVYLIEDPVLGHYRTQPYLHAMTELVLKYKPDVFLLGATTMGRDLAGAVATTLQTGLTADCTGLEIDPNSKLLEQTRPAYGGNIMATILCEKRRPQMSTVRPRVMAMPPRDPKRAGMIVEETLGLREEDIPVKIVEYIREQDTGQVRLEDADIIVSGGKGLGTPDGFRMLEELAEVLGGVVGASRGAVDAGWIPAAHQVGQTGKTVRPKVYIACGISGAIQHLVGMQTSDVIIAINNDPEAPIFKVATWGVVGDAYKVVPALTEEFRAKLAGGRKEAVSSQQ